MCAFTGTVRTTQLCSLGVNGVSVASWEMPMEVSFKLNVHATVDVDRGKVRRGVVRRKS